MVILSRTKQLTAVESVPMNYDHCGIVGAASDSATISVTEDDTVVQGKGRHGAGGDGQQPTL
jgi:hypothetical protein